MITSDNVIYWFFGYLMAGLLVAGYKRRKIIKQDKGECRLGELVSDVMGDLDQGAGLFFVFLWPFYFVYLFASWACKNKIADFFGRAWVYFWKQVANIKV